MQQFFPQVDQESDENYKIRLQALFRLLSNWKNFQTMQLTDFFQHFLPDIQEVQNQISQDIKLIKSIPKYSEIDFQEFLEQLSDLKNSKIVPLHFIQIKQNSIIFCSSEFNLVSFHLPFRFYKIGLETQVNSYLLLIQNYLIYESVKEVIKSYYSHIRFCSMPFS